jgi:putative transposase
VKRQPAPPFVRLRLIDWPEVDAKALRADVRAEYRRRSEAVEAYARGAALADIETNIGVHRGTVLRMIARARKPHPDGRLWGFRALVPRARVQPYERVVAPRVLTHTTAGNAGAFGQLLQRHPSLHRQLRSELTERRVTLRPSGTASRMHDVKGAVARFHAACRELGLGAGDYPFNQQDRAVRSLGRTLRAWLEDDFSLALRTAGARFKPSSALRRTERAALKAYDTVEFDAHKLDLRLKVILEQDPLGGEHALEIERVWVLAIIDVATRCVLSWNLSLSHECNRFDAIETMKRALVPMSRPDLTLPGLRLLPTGGFVTQTFDQTAFACWRQIRLDNARAHLATTSLDVICETLGCTADFGPAYEPDDRPFVERFFGSLTTTLARRLPGGIDPTKLKVAIGRLRDPKDTLQLLVTAQELEELLAMTVWNYHGTPHAGLGGLTPLEAMGQQLMGIRGEPALLRRLHPTLRKHPQLLHDPVLCRVRGNLARGERPHISYLHVRYTSDQLARRTSLIGKDLRVHVDPTDLRTVLATTAQGDILEPLQASGAWRSERHSQWLRQAFYKAKRQRELDFAMGDDPIEAFLSLRKRQASKRKRAASDVARVQHERTLKPAAKAQTKAAVADTTPNADGLTEALAAQLATDPVKPRKLRIAPGQVY